MESIDGISGNDDDDDDDALVLMNAKQCNEEPDIYQLLSEDVPCYLLHSLSLVLGVLVL
jgi:hypothetical protein